MTDTPSHIIAALVEGVPAPVLDEPPLDPPDLSEADDDGEPLPPPPPPDADVDLATLADCAALEQNDTDNGRRLLNHFGERIMHVREIGWHTWTGQLWKREGGDEAVTILAQRTAKRIHLEADVMSFEPYEERLLKAGTAALAKPEANRNDADNEAIEEASRVRAALGKRRIGRRKFAVASGNGAKVSAMIGQALPHTSFGPTDLDADPALLNIENGTLRFAKVEDLECPDPDVKRYTLAVELLPHDRAHRITKLAPVSYQPEAACPRWDEFLAWSQPKEPMRRFLQVYHGLALTGWTGHQSFIYAHGGGANGKSTFSEGIANILGTYSDLLNAESITGQGQRRGDQATPDLADLPGVRYLRISELPRGESLKENLIKSLTGGEKIKARQLNKGFFSFEPVFKAHMSGNDMPQIGGLDEGIWRRVKLTPWSVTILPEKRRPMAEVLAEFQAEGAGILNWLIEGLRIFLEEGLVIPQEVLDATAAYRAEMDPIAAFAKDCLREDMGGFVTARDVYQAFLRWCDANSVRPWKETMFGKALPMKGYVRENARVRRYLNVRLDLSDLPELSSNGPRAPFAGDGDAR